MKMRTLGVQILAVKTKSIIYTVQNGIELRHREYRKSHSSNSMKHLLSLMITYLTVVRLAM